MMQGLRQEHYPGSHNGPHGGVKMLIVDDEFEMLKRRVE